MRSKMYEVVITKNEHGSNKAYCTCLLYEEVIRNGREEMSKEKNTNQKMSKKKIAIIIAVIVVVLMGLMTLIANWMMPKTIPIEKSTIFSAEEVEVKCLAVIFALNAEDYEALQKDYVDEAMKSILTKEYMDTAKSSLNVDWKASVAFGEPTIVEITQRGKTYAAAQYPVTYGDTTVTYTLSFDTDYKLAGLYMK